MSTIDIPINVEVKCCGRNCGRSTHIVLNPVTKEITHLVVKQRAFPHTERLVPVEFVVESTPRLVRLRCDAPHLDTMEEFVKTEFVEPADPHVVGGTLLMWPYTYNTEEHVSRAGAHLPLGELAVRRGARVIAEDGDIGQVDEFVVDRRSEHITHLVMREGSLWDQKDITIPVSCIERIGDEAIYLNIDKASVAALPTLPDYRE
jgi:sporulation protein YlmC with PRC-barrel domain